MGNSIEGVDVVGDVSSCLEANGNRAADEHYDVFTMTVFAVRLRQFA